jgi:hypothetical protein
MLVNSDTGDILLIDFTESHELRDGSNGSYGSSAQGGGYSTQDLQLADTFMRVAAAAVPADCLEETKTAVREAVERIGGTIHPQLHAVLAQWM